MSVRIDLTGVFTVIAYAAIFGMPAWLGWELRGLWDQYGWWVAARWATALHRRREYYATPVGDRTAFADFRTEEGRAWGVRMLRAEGYEQVTAEDYYRHRWQKRLGGVTTTTTEVGHGE